MTMSRKNFEILQGWFYENHVVLNPGKCHYLIVNKDNESGRKTLYSKAEQKLLGIIIDKNFQSHTKSIIKTANQKLSDLIIVATLMTDFRKKVIFNSFIKKAVQLFLLLCMLALKL